ncbi:hypothetical protein FACS1894180_4270 [Bacteroidia bacterium]|nr:hypothetical protein FACS1894180_4270 [Bacteroidia bacterium]
MLFVLAGILNAQPLVSVFHEQFSGNNAGGIEGSTIIGDAGVWNVNTPSGPATCFWKWADAVGPNIPQGHGDRNRIMCYSTNESATNSWLFSPSIPMQANVEYTITFWARKVGNPTATIEAWAGSNPADLTTGTITQVAALTIAYVMTTMTFTPTSAGNYHLGFHCNSPVATGTGTYYAMLDDIEIVAALAGGNAGVTEIVAPVNHTNLGNENVSIVIQNFGDETLTSIPVAFSVNDGTPVTSVWNGTLASGATTTFDFTQTADLSVAGAHIIKAWTDLPGDILVSNDTLTKTVVNTPCDIISTFPYEEGFDESATVLPDCWLKYQALFNNPVVNVSAMQATSSGWILSDNNSGLTGNHLEINTYGSNVNGWLVTPPIDLSTGNNLQLTFDLALTAYSGKNQPAATTGIDDRFIVVVSTDAGRTWDIANATVWDNNGAVNVFNSIATTGQRIGVDLSQYSGIVKIAFYAESTVNNTDNVIHIDNIGIASCIKPVALTINDVTHNTANISWAAGNNATEWNVVVSATPLSDPSTGTIHHVTDANYPIASLSASTLYYVYVQSDCGNSDVSMWVTSTFMTTYLPATLPYEPAFTTNDSWVFTNSDELVNQWFIGSTSGTPDNYPVTNGLYVTYNNGETNEYIETEATTIYAYKTLYLDHTGTIKVSFQWRSNGGDENYDFMRAFLVPTNVVLNAGDRPRMTGAVPEGWHDLMNGELGQMQNTYQTVEKEITVNEVQNMNLVFYWTNDGTVGFSPSASITNLKVEYIDCIMPTNIQVNDVTDQNAIVSWTADAETAWNIVVSETELNDPSTSTAIETITENPYSISSLNPQTLYYVYVQANCGTSVSNWISVSFHTAITPQIPTTLPYKPELSSNDGWELTNIDAVNQWFIGSTTGGNNAVTNGLYISSDNGISNSYDVSATTSVYAYRTLQIDQTGTLLISYDWRNAGEVRYDYLRVFLAPINAALESGTHNGITHTDTPDGWISLSPYIDETVGSQLSGNGNEYTHVQQEIEIAQTDNFNLVFYWRNDYATGATPPASVVNIWARMKVANLAVEASSVHSGDTDIPVDNPITIQFNNLVNINGEPNLSGVTLASATETIEATVTFADSTVTITPSANLAPDTEYTLTIPAGTIAGIDYEIKYTFTTSAGSGAGNVQTANMHIYPTVTEGNVTVVAPAGSTLKIADLAGRILNSYNLVNTSQSIYLNCKAGAYLLIIENGNEKKVEKIIVK